MSICLLKRGSTLTDTIFTKFQLTAQCLVKRSYAKFYENPRHDLVADTIPQKDIKDGRKSRRTDGHLCVMRPCFFEKNAKKEGNEVSAHKETFISN